MDESLQGLFLLNRCPTEPNGKNIQEKESLKLSIRIYCTYDIITVVWGLHALKEYQGDWITSVECGQEVWGGTSEASAVNGDVRENQGRTWNKMVRRHAKMTYKEWPKGNGKTPK